MSQNSSNVTGQCHFTRVFPLSRYKQELCPNSEIFTRTIWGHADPSICLFHHTVGFLNEGIWVKPPTFSMLLMNFPTCQCLKLSDPQWPWNAEDRSLWLTNSDLRWNSMGTEYDERECEQKFHIYQGVHYLKIFLTTVQIIKQRTK